MNDVTQAQTSGVRVSGVAGELFAGVACMESGTVLAFRYEGADTVFYEYGAGGTLIRTAKNDEVKPAHWKPALRFFGKW